MVSVVLAVKPFTQVPPRTDGIPKDETGDGSEMPRKHSTSRKKYQEEPKTCSEINKDDAAGTPHWQVKKKIIIIRLFQGSWWHYLVPKQKSGK